MGKISTLTTSGWLQSTSQASLGNASTFSVKMRMDAQTLRDGIIGRTLFRVHDDANTKSKVRIDVNDPAVADFRLRIRAATSTVDNYYNTQTGDILDSNLPANGSDVILYFHVSPTNVSLELFDDVGTSLGSASQSDSSQTMPTGTDWGNIRFGTFFNGDLHFLLTKVDGMAIYSATLTGADRYSKPATGDANIIALWWFDETSGSTAANEIGGGVSLSAQGVESTDFQWVAGGTWDGASTTFYNDVEIIATYV